MHFVSCDAGKRALGVYVVDELQREVLQERRIFRGEEKEYTPEIKEACALLHALKWLHENQVDSAMLWMDCKSIVGKIHRRFFKDKNPTGLAITSKCIRFLDEHDSWILNWVPREANREADRVCKGKEAIPRNGVSQQRKTF